MPSTIQFHTFKKEYGEPSVQGLSQKLETFFRVCKLVNYDVNFTATHTGHVPNVKGKQLLPRPYIIVAGKIAVVDMHLSVIQYLSENGVVRDLDAGLTSLQRADSRAWQAYLQGPPHDSILWTRFGYPENRDMLREDLREVAVETSAPTWFGQKSSFSRSVGIVQRSLIERGPGKRSRAEVDRTIQEFVTNITEKLNASPGRFFHGSEPTTIDCALYGFLVSALRMKSNPTFTKTVLANRVLRDYIARGTRLWFPEYKGILEMVTAQPPESANGSINVENGKEKLAY